MSGNQKTDLCEERSNWQKMMIEKCGHERKD